MNDQRIVIVGGCGRVGLPLGLVLAMRGRDVTLLDTDADRVADVQAGRMPYGEPGTYDLGATGAEPGEVGEVGSLTATADPKVLVDADVVIVAVGTPTDEHGNPDPAAIPDLISHHAQHLRNGQLIVLRSTVHPGTTTLVQRRLNVYGINAVVMCCPERISQGHAMEELGTLPQIIGTSAADQFDRAEALFAPAPAIWVTPAEAEFAKLITNAWRYTQFAFANQMWAVAADAGLDYTRIHHAVTDGYPRADGLTLPGFAAGPCLLKDTQHLVAASGNSFTLGQQAIHINEGLPLHLVNRIEEDTFLSAATVGILGMAFKADTDDTRGSLGFKLRKILRGRCHGVLATDAHATDDRFVDLEVVLDRADILIVAVPHAAYRGLETDVPVYDIWGVVDGTRWPG